MGIDQVQRTQQAAAPAAASQSPGTPAAQQQQTVTCLALNDAFSGRDPFRRSDAQFPVNKYSLTGDSAKPRQLAGSVDGSLLIYFNTRTKEPQLMLMAKGEVRVIKLDHEKALGLGVAAGGNGLTNVVTPMVVGTILDRDYGDDGDPEDLQHLKLDVELGVSMIHDQSYYMPDYIPAANYDALRMGVNFSPEKNLNLMCGVDVSNKAVSPFIGFGGRFACHEN